MPAPNDLTHLSVANAARAIRKSEISAQNLVEAHIHRIAQREPDIGAWAHFDPENAQEQAHIADKHQKSGAALGPLHGVPVAIKDIIDTKDMPTQNGCPIFDGRQPKTDAACVTALKKAGAIILGKTETTELALLTPARTKNPINPDHTPGGSSAGSAAAVADHMAPAALGTQTAGSVLRPASYCGTYGFKPTRGVIPRSGVLMQSHTLDTVGMLTRSLEDTALLTQVLAVFDPDDDVAISLDCTNIVETTTTPLPTKPKFAFVKTPAWADAAPELHSAYAEFVKQLKDVCETVEIELFADIIEWQRIVQIAENATYYGPLLDKYPQHISKGLTQRIQQGRKEEVTGYIDAIIAREKAYAAVEHVLNSYDAILTPPAPGPAPNGLSITGSPIFNGSWTYLGVPTLSAPLLSANNLPLGVQLVGKRRQDARLLQTASWLENHLDAK